MISSLSKHALFQTALSQVSRQVCNDQTTLHARVLRHETNSSQTTQRPSRTFITIYHKNQNLLLLGITYQYNHSAVSQIPADCHRSEHKRVTFPTASGVQVWSGQQAVEETPAAFMVLVVRTHRMVRATLGIRKNMLEDNDTWSVSYFWFTKSFHGLLLPSINPNCNKVDIQLFSHKIQN